MRPQYELSRLRSADRCERLRYGMAKIKLHINQRTRAVLQLNGDIMQEVYRRQVPPEKAANGDRELTGTLF
jgi:hypothetical protein